MSVMRRLPVNPVIYPALAMLVTIFAAVALGQPTTTPTAPTTTTTSSSANAGPAVIIRLEGEIDDFNRDALFRRFKEARRFGATTVILDVNTYGGLVTAGLYI